MKFTLSGVLAILVLVAPLEVWGAYNDVTLTTDTVLSVGGITVNVSGSSAAVESITVGESTFNVTLLPSSSITVTSANREELNVNTEAYTTAYNCNSLTLTGSGSSAVVTVTPDSTDLCATGGGGGGGSKKKTPVQPTPTPSTPSQPAKSVTPAAQGTVIFTTNLSLGMTSPDVTRLQTVLAGRADLYPEGTVSGYFGPLTMRAVERFQVAYGVASAGLPGYGSVGPKTREKLQQVFSAASGAATVVAPAPVSAVASTALFIRDLQKNSSGADVKQLQMVLNSNVATQITASGAGSPGNETDYFGLLTEKAVQKFQEKYGIAVSGDSGYGIVGPLTRAKLIEVASKR